MVSKNISYREGGRYWSRDWEEIDFYREGHGDGPEDKGKVGVWRERQQAQNEGRKLVGTESQEKRRTLGDDRESKGS